MAGEPMSERELKTFSDKLEAFVHGLTVREQALLRDILARAALSDDGDVHGHSMIVDPVVTKHVSRLSSMLSWPEVRHNLHAVVVHLGDMYNANRHPRFRR